MTTIQVFDPPMCCSTGVCGPSVDPALARFAADLEWLRGRGFAVERFNLSQQPGAFVGDALVKQALADDGQRCLPLILVDGRIVSRGVYPAREALVEAVGAMTGTPARAPSALRLVEAPACPTPTPGAPRCC